MKNSLPILSSALLCILVSLTNCSSKPIQLSSSPNETAVFVGAVGSNQLSPLGKTPLNLNVSQIYEVSKGTGPMQFEFRKEGFLPFRIIVMDLSSSEIKINPELIRVSGLESEEALNRIVDDLFEAQRLARSGKYDEAISKLKTLQVEVPQISAPYEMEGALYFLKKDFVRSLDAYRLAEKRNPKNNETLQMKKKIERELAGK